jgi:hypothetical protein
MLASDAVVDNDAEDFDCFRIGKSKCVRNILTLFFDGLTRSHPLGVLLAQIIPGF